MLAFIPHPLRMACILEGDLLNVEKKMFTFVNLIATFFLNVPDQIYVTYKQKWKQPTRNLTGTKPNSLGKFPNRLIFL